MQEQFGLFEAKNRLSELAAMVARTGRPITVTRRGKPLVDIVPASETTKETRESVAAAFKELEEWGKKHPMILYEGETLKDLIEYGRR